MTPDRVGRRFISLRAKFLVGMGLVLLVVMCAVIVVVEYRQRVAIIGEVRQRGEVIARSLAAISTGPLVLYNFPALQENVARVAGEVDVVYALILDAEGKVAADSRHPERVGGRLTGAVHERAGQAAGPLVQERRLADTGEWVYDFAIPIEVEGQRWGTVRVGVSRRRMDAEISRRRWELGALTAAAF